MNPGIRLEDPGDEDDDPDDVTSAPTDRPGIPHEDDFGNIVVNIVDVAGIRYLPLITCGCQGKDKLVEECMTAGLFPVSYESIRTLFTFKCLDEFRLLNLEGKLSAYQYHQILRRRTNPQAPNSVADKYTALRRMSRQWRILKKYQQHGFGINPSPPGTGDLTIFCPACPQAGINLPEDWEKSVPM